MYQSITSLLTVLYNFPINSISILWSHNTPNAPLHYIHLTLILWFSSSLISSSLWIIDSRYQKLLLFGISWPLSLTTPSSLFLLLLNLHFLYFVLVLLNQESLGSKASRQIYNLTLTSYLVSSTKTISATKSIHLLDRFSELIHHWCKEIWT